MSVNDINRRMAQEDLRMMTGSSFQQHPKTETVRALGRWAKHHTTQFIATLYSPHKAAVAVSRNKNPGPN